MCFVRLFLRRAPYTQDDKFEHSRIGTIGVDFRFRTITIDGKSIKLQIVCWRN